MIPSRFVYIATTAEDSPSPSFDDALRRCQADSRRRLIWQNGRNALFVAVDAQYLISACKRMTIVGPIFDRQGKSVSHLDADIHLEPEAAFRQILSTMWGSYVAFHRDDCGNVSVLRDPSATAPCYVIEHIGNMLAVASHIRDVFDLTGQFPIIDWGMVVRHMIVPGYRDQTTALQKTTEVLPGAYCAAESPVLSKPLWSPWDYACRSEMIWSPNAASGLLRETLLLCIGAWGARTSKALVSLSGGLDSSIVCAALAHHRLPMSAITILSGTATGDEQRYAELVAGTLGIPLVCRHLDEHVVDITASSAAHLPRPTARMFWQSADALLTEAASDVGATSHYHGGGGDNVFCYLRSVAPILDRIKNDGFGKGAISTIRDLCALTGSDAWDVSRRTVARLISGRCNYNWKESYQFLSTAGIKMGKWKLDHPWLSVPRGGFAGSAAHIAMILAIHNYLEGYRRELETSVVAPLLSQPLIELCLRIPSWMWCEDGENRVVARRAFADLLPQAILRRRSKGTPDGYSMAIFDDNRSRIRSFLRDGLLAQHGLIDLDAIDQALADHSPIRGAAYSRILSFCDIEAWARAWS